MTPMRGSDDAVRRFYAYLVARERVRLRKEAGLPWPWTDDPILQQYKFTNVRRSDDRTTRYLVDNFYRKRRTASPATCLMNCAIYRYHGTLEFAEAVGWSTMFPQALERVERTARGRMLDGQRVFTGAYVITNQGIKGPKERVVRGFLEALWHASDDLVALASVYNSWREVAGAMAHLKGFGGTGFMTKEVLLDTMHTNFWPEGGPRDKETWTPIGPGAERGLGRIYGPVEAGQARRFGKGGLRFMQLQELWELQDQHWPREISYGEPLASEPPPLSMHDVQFGLCEFDKYERVRLGEGRPRSRYKHKRP